MVKNAKIERTQKLFLAALKKKFSEDLPIYTTGNIQQTSQEHVTLIPFKDPCDLCTNLGARCPNDPLCKLYDYRQFVHENEKTGEIYERSF